MAGPRDARGPPVTPTINVLWKIARALGVPFSALISDPSASPATVLRATQAKVLTSHDGGFVSRALFRSDSSRAVEFYELRADQEHG